MPNCEICGEPMPPGEEMFKYHGYSGPCPKPHKRLEKVHEAVGDNLNPQGPTYHWRNGWMFARGEAGDVHIWNIERGIDLIIPTTEWASIVASVSAHGETGDAYRGTFAFHMGKVT